MVNKPEPPQGTAIRHPIPFNTLDYAEKLQHMGVSAKSAKAQSQLLAEVISGTMVTVASKQETQEQISGIENRLEAKIESSITKLQVSMVCWYVVSTAIALVGIVAMGERISAFFSKLL